MLFKLTYCYNLFMILNLVGLFLSLMGIYISFLIHQEKKKESGMSCFLNGQCESVLKSKYSKVLGINLEYFGIIFYALLAWFFTGSVLNIEFFLKLKILAFICISGGFLFSIYLACVQKFIIKNWCTWCLFSGLTNFLLFVSVLINFKII